MNEKLQKILQARENRVINQRKLLKKYCLPILSITLNIPGPEKDNKKIREVFHQCLKVVRIELKKSEKSKIIFEKNYFTADGPEFFLVVKGLFEKDLKKIAVKIEDEHPFGRLFDIDVLSRDGHKIYRKDVGSPLRKCIICKNAAINCITSRKHNREEVIKITRKMIDDFISLKK